MGSYFLKIGAIGPCLILSEKVFVFMVKFIKSLKSGTKDFPPILGSLLKFCLPLWPSLKYLTNQLFLKHDQNK